MKKIIAFMSCLAASPAVASPQMLYEADNWKVAVATSDAGVLTCTMIGLSNEPGAFMAFGVDEDDFYTTAFKITTAQPRGYSNSVTIDIYIDANLWTLSDGTEVPLSTGIYYTINTGYGNDPVTSDFIRDLMRSNFLRINSDTGSSLFTLPLAGSAKAIVALEQCRGLIARTY